MAYREIKHECGHTDRVQLYGKHSNRDIEAERLERQDCANCLKAKKEKKIAEENEISAKLAELVGLPILTGSAKQVAWATSIRQKVYDDLIFKLSSKDILISILSA